MSMIIFFVVLGFVAIFFFVVNAFVEQSIQRQNEINRAFKGTVLSDHAAILQSSEDWRDIRKKFEDEYHDACQEIDMALNENSARCQLDPSADRSI